MTDHDNQQEKKTATKKERVVDGKLNEETKWLFTG